MNTPSKHITAAANRFGLGAKPGELDSIRDPRGWLVAQLKRDPDGASEFAGLPSSLDYLREAGELRQTRRKLKRGGDAQASASDRTARAAQLKAALKPLRQRQRAQLLAEIAARYRVVTTTTTPFNENLVHFWSNHFAVSVDKHTARMFAAPMEREAIRPHVSGRFSDLLLAVETHPAMLLYLDSVRSVGPDSRLGRRLTKRLARRGEMAKGKAGGLNENLGREAMELHTVGVNGGYTQTDVTEFSRALTGWGVASRRDYAHGRSPDSAFVFHAAAHQPGSVRVMGRTFAQAGFEQGKAILEFLARQPATAQHLSLQLARHFVSDDPPPALVERMARSYLKHDTDLAAVYRTLILSPEAWSEDARKFRTPQDFMIASLRAGQIELGAKPGLAVGLLKTLGEPLFTPRSPAGFSDDSAHWIDANGLYKRVQAAEALASRVPSDSAAPLAWAQDILGARLDAETTQAIRRAESKRQARALLFACPAFQWRA